MMEQLKLALVQDDLLWEDVKGNLEKFERVLSGIDSSTHLVVFPEMFTSGFTMNPERVAEPMDGPSVGWMTDKARELGIALAGSLVIKEKGEYRNRFLFVRPDGKFEFYDKRHSFTYAGEHKKYRCGSDRKTIHFNGWKIFPQICYDLRFPVFSRNDLDYDLLLYVANWPEVRIDAWDALLKARAIENMAYSVGVNRIGKDGNNYPYPGHTSVYTELGRPLAFTDQKEVVYVTLDKAPLRENREKLRFLEDRDRFTLE